MGNFTIECVGYNEEDGFVWSHEEQHQQLEIRCNDKIDNNSFTMEYYGDEGILIRILDLFAALKLDGAGVAHADDHGVAQLKAQLAEVLIAIGS